MLASLVNIAALSAGLYIAESEPISWIKDDWRRAKSRALTENKLVAVDVWATWCHTCLSMKNFVFTQPAFAELQSQHVWLALDYDQPKNADFFRKYTINAFPTFMVIDPTTDKVVGRWLGSGTTNEMLQFFRSAKRSPDSILSQVEIALASQKYKDAIDLVESNLTTKKNKHEQTRLLSAYAEALRITDAKACAIKNETFLDQVANNAQGLDYVMLVGSCAESVPDSNAKSRILSKIRDRLVLALQSNDLDISADDHSSILATLSSIYKASGNDLLAHRTKVQQMTLLERAAQKARSPRTKATFDAHRFSCYLSLGEFAKAEHMLQATQRQLPKDFNTLWRLALLYRHMNRFDEGISAINRALSLGYGPRRIRLFSAKIDLLVANNQNKEAKEVSKLAREEIASQDKSLIRTYWLNELDSKEKLIQSGRGR